MQIIESAPNMRNGGHYTFIELDGIVYYIDSAKTLDNGYETMIFECEDKNNYQESINFDGVYKCNYEDIFEMVKKHNEIINMSDDEFKNLIS